jgi:hypothetical protein
LETRISALETVVRDLETNVFTLETFVRALETNVFVPKTVVAATGRLPLKAGEDWFAAVSGSL